MPTSITQNNNEVIIGESNPSISITDNNKGTTVDVGQVTITSVTVNQAGVQGPAGSVLDIPSANIIQPLVPIKVEGTISSSGNISTQGNISGVEFTGTSFEGIFKGALSSSAQIASDISGSFTAPSSSFESRLTTVEALNTSKTLISSSLQFTSTDDVQFRNITASGDISASGDIHGGSLTTDQFIYHAGDPNTYLNFTDDRLRFNIGGVSYLDLNDASTAPHDIIFNNGNNNVDLTIKGSSDTILFTDASTHRVGIGTETPGKELEVVGDISASNTLIGQTGSFGYITTEEYITHKGDENTAIRFTNNKISFDAGGMTFFAVHDDDSAPFTATVNGGGNPINFRALDENQNVLLKTDSEAFNVGLYYKGNKKLETAVGGVDITGNITASGNISASGGIDAANIDASTSLQVNSKRITYANNDLTFLDTGLNVAGGNITASGNISASGIITAEHFHSSDDVQIDDNLQVDGQTTNEGNLNVGGNIQVGTGGTPNWLVVPPSTITVTGDIKTSTHITASGNISASGTVTANSFVGTLTGTATGLSGTPDITVGDISANSLHVTSITSSIVSSSILQTSGSNIFGDTSDDTHTFVGNVTASAIISASGDIIAPRFLGSVHSPDGGVMLQNASNVAVILGTDTDTLKLDGSSLNLSAGPISTSNTFTSTNYISATNITASGDISASGNIYASNIVLPNDGMIAPSVNHQTIKFMTKPPGTSDNGERFTLGPDLIEFSGITGTGTNYSLLQMDMTDGAEVIQFNASSNDVDFKIFSDNQAVMVMNAEYDAFAFRDHVGIGYNANKWPTDNYGITGTYDKQLMVNGLTHLTGSVEIIGPVTASGNISASGDMFLSQSLSFASGTISQPNQIISNNLKIGAGTNDHAFFTDDYVQIFADGSNVFQIAGLGSPSIGLNPNALDVDVTINTDGATVFQSIGSTDKVTIGGTTNYFNTASLIEHNADTVFQQGVTIENKTTSGSSGLIVTGSGGHIYTTGNITASSNISASGFVAGIGWRGNGKIYPGYNVSNTHFLGKTTSTNPIIRAAGGFNVEGALTASGDISASGQGTFTGGVKLTDANYDAAGTAKYRVDGYSVLQNSTTELKIAGNNYWEKISYGNENTDQHSFNGAITSSGDISSSGTITANNLTVHTTFLANRLDRIDNAKIGVEFGDGINVSGGHVTASSNISASGDLIANNATINEGFVTVDGASTSHGFELKRDSLDTYKIRHLDGGLTIQNSTDNRKEMTFDGAGNVGIGTTSPTEKLQVEGNISSSGTIDAENYKLHGNNAIGSFTAGSGYSLDIGYDTNTTQIHIGREGATKQTTIHGHISASGAMSASGNIYGSDYYSDNIKILSFNAGTAQLGSSTGTSKIEIGKTNVTNQQILMTSPLTASIVSASGNIIGSSGSFADVQSEGGISLTNQVQGYQFDNIPILYHDATDLVIGESSNYVRFAGPGIITGDINASGHITASGNISGSLNGSVSAGTGSFHVLKGKSTSANGLEVNGYISAIHVTASGYIQGNIIYDTGSISATGNVQGDIVRFGNSTTLAGAIYAHTGSGWTLAHSGSSGCASSSLALAVGTNSSDDGMLLRGMANIGYDPGGDNGCALYLESPGSASHNVTATSGHVARVVGWNYGTDTIYFNPDNTWVVK